MPGWAVRAGGVPVYLFGGYVGMLGMGAGGGEKGGVNLGLKRRHVCIKMRYNGTPPGGNRPTPWGIPAYLAGSRAVANAGMGHDAGPCRFRFTKSVSNTSPTTWAVRGRATTVRGRSAAATSRRELPRSSERRVCPQAGSRPVAPGPSSGAGSGGAPLGGYYTGRDGELAGRWAAAGAMGVAVGAPVTPEQLAASLSAVDPETGERLGRRYTPGGTYVDNLGVTRRRRKFSA